MRMRKNSTGMLAARYSVAKTNKQGILSFSPTVGITGY